MASSNRAAPRRTSTVLALACALWGGGLAVGCGPDSGPEPEPAPEDAAAPAPAWPEGTVLAANGVAITADEVDEYVDLVALIEPEFVLNDHRRKVLANISIPTLATRVVFPEERLEAYTIAQQYLSHARETGTFPPGVEPRYVSGTWRDVGMVEWDAARDTEVGGFSALRENPGSWSFVKVLATNAPEGEDWKGTTQVTLQVVDVPFLDTPDMHDIIEQARDELQFEVIDPEWEPLVPPYWLYDKSTLLEEKRR